jgi:tRNA A-37 threonylcarbamoyl transferase component Bud32
MANDQAGVLIDLLKDNQILDPAQLDELNKTPDVRNTDPETLARCLIELGWITLYQLEMLIGNKAQELRIGNYLVLDKAGIGDLGPAYKVRRPGKPGTFILKLIPKSKFEESDQLPRFNQDVRLAAQIQHPHIAPVATVGQHNNQYLFVREYVDGVDLAQFVRDSGPLSIPRACAFTRQAALALQHAHDKGLIHRRVKPSNLVMLKEGSGNGQGPSIKVVDFGLANIRPRTRDDKGDRDGDLRALGRTLCYLLTGRSPAPPDTSWQTPPGSGPLSTLRPGIPLEVQSIALKLLGAGSATGYRNMAEVATALETHAREPVAAPVSRPATNGVSDVVPSAVAVPLGPAPAVIPVPFATAAVAAVPVGAAAGRGLAEEPAVAEFPFAMAVTQAVAVHQLAEAGTTEENADAIPVATAAPPMPEPVAPGLATQDQPADDGIPMATAAPPMPVPVAPQVIQPAEDDIPMATAAPPMPVPVGPADATPASEVPAVSAAVSPQIEPVPMSPAFGLEAVPFEAPPQTAGIGADTDIPMASAVTAAVPASFATEPEVVTQSTAPVGSGEAALPALTKPVAPEPQVPASEPPPLVQAASAPIEPPPLHLPELAPTQQPSTPPPLAEAGPEFSWQPPAAPSPMAVPPVEPVQGTSTPPSASPEPQAGAAVTAPENIPMGSAFPEPSAGFTATPPSGFTDTAVEESAPFPMGAAPPRRKTRRKLSKGSIIGLIIGGLLHLIFIVGIILWAMGVFSPSEPPTKPKPTAQRVVTRPKPTGPTLPMDLRKKENKNDDVDPFKDVKD